MKLGMDFTVKIFVSYRYDFRCSVFGGSTCAAYLALYIRMKKDHNSYIAQSFAVFPDFLCRIFLLSSKLDTPCEVGLFDSLSLAQIIS